MQQQINNSQTPIQNNIQPNFDDIQDNELIEGEGDINNNIPNQTPIQQNNQEYDDEGNEIPQEDSELEKQLKINTVMEYNRVMGEELKAFESKFDIEYLDSLNSEQLDKLLMQLEVASGSSNSANLIRPCVSAGIGMMESTGCNLGMRWQGLQNLLMTSKEFDKSLTLIKLKYGRQMYVDPILSACLVVLQSAMYLDHQNRVKEALIELGKSKLDDKVNSEFKDL